MNYMPKLDTIFEMYSSVTSGLGKVFSLIVDSNDSGMYLLLSLVFSIELVRL